MLATAIVGASISHADQNFSFQRISLEHGLSQSTVLCLLEDSRGFLWAGGEYGLNRYDGFGFTVLSHDPADAASLAANKVTALAEDREGFIWVGTEKHGLDRLEPGRGRFTHFVHDPTNPITLPSNEVRDLLVDAAGTLWVATSQGLARRAEGAANFESFRCDPGLPGSLSDDLVTALHQGPSGRLWVGTAVGVDLLDVSTGIVQRIRVGDEPVRVTAIVEMPDGTVWIGTRGHGLWRLDLASRVLTSYRSEPGDPTTPSSDEIAALCRDTRGMLWVGTEDLGINRFDPAAGVALRLAFNTESLDGLPSSGVKALLLGRSSILWVGTDLAGLAKLDLKDTPFRHYHTSGTGALKLATNPVFSVLEDSRGELWVGLRNGVQRIDLTANLSRLFDDPRAHPGSPHLRPVYAIHEDRAGFLWFGTWQGGLVRLSPSRTEVAVFRHDPSDPDSLADDSVFAVHEDRAGHLWVGTVGAGLDMLDRAIGCFQHHRAGPAPPALSHDTVRAVLEDSQGVLWVGTVGGGVCVRDPATGRFSWHRHDPEVPGSLSDNAVAALHEDRSGTVWVATGGGLNRFHRATGRFEHFRVRDGLPSDAITGVLDDERGRIWVAHFKGLSCLDPATGTFTNFDASHGLQSDEFNSAAVAAGRGGEMFFGGVNGLTEFRPSEVGRNPTPPLVSITSVRAYDRELSIPTAPLGDPLLRLHHRQDFLSFEFVGLEFTAPDRIRYPYRMEGLDRDWIDSGTRRHASYAHVPPGRYVFRVRACNHDGVWNDAGGALRIEISPPWWETPLARAAAVVVALLLVVLVIRWRTRALRQRLAEQQRVERIVRESRDQLAQANVELERYSNQLEEMVAERTSQLAEANTELNALATHDSLTGLANRRRFTEFIAAEWRRAHRFHRPVAVIMADIDFFKAYNDSSGHQAGDACLRRVAEILRVVANRPGDLLARWGGEEFVAVLSETASDVALALAERMRAAVEEAEIPHRNAPRKHVTVSLGVAAAVPREDDWEELVAAADSALYTAKSAGRNSAVLAPLRSEEPG